MTMRVQIETVFQFSIVSQNLIPSNAKTLIIEHQIPPQTPRGGSLETKLSRKECNN